MLLSDLVGPWWIGLFDYAELEYWRDGAKVALHCIGWSAVADDRVYVTRQVFEAGDTAATMFTHSRNALCPGISSTNAYIAATANVALGEESKNYRGDPAISVWNTAASLGSTYATADPLIWLVHGPPLGSGLPTNVPVLEVFALPDAATYTIDLEDGYSVRTKVERSQVRNHIIVNYGSGGTGDILHEPEQDNALAEAISINGVAEMNYRERQMWVDASEGIQGQALLAQRIADANLTKYGRVHGSGFSTMIPFDGTGAHAIVGSELGTVPIWRVEPGRLLNVTNDQAWSGLPNNPARLITQVHGSLKRGEVQITTGIMGDSRQAQRMTGVRTLRQALDLPPLSRPNRPDEWQRVNIELGPWVADGELGFVLVEFPHIIRTITAFTNTLEGEDGVVESVEIEIGVGPQGAFPSYETLTSTTVSDGRTQVLSGQTRRVDAGANYYFRYSEPVPDGVMVLVQVGVDRIKVVE